MATYLVTGGAGFIGSHLCDELVKNHQVYVLDNLSTGSVNNLPKGVQFIEGDITDYAQLESLMSKVDGCFHLAALVSVPLCNNDFFATHAINLTGTLNVLESAKVMAKKSKMIPVVFASSSAVYGDSQALPNEESGQTIPISVYAASKLCSEYYGRYANEISKVPFTGLRLFNVYGARQRLDSSYSGVISIFLNALLQGKPCIIYGDGKQSRDFIFVKDVVQFFIRAMQIQSQQAHVYNVCTGQSTDIKTLTTLLSQILHKPLQIDYQAARLGDILHSLGNPALAAQELGMVATTSIEMGLQQLVAEVLK